MLTPEEKALVAQGQNLQGRAAELEELESRLVELQTRVANLRKIVGDDARDFRAAMKAEAAKEPPPA